MEYCDAVARTACPEVFKAGFWDRSAGTGAGFTCGGAADRLAPGPVLAEFASRVWECGLGGLSDDELVGVLRAGRRMASWSAALELGATGELMERRLAQEAAGEAGVAQHAGDEIAAALTLTARSADRLADQALGLARLPLTQAALARGDIDLPRASVIIDEVSCLDAAHAQAVEQVVIGAAPGQTSGQLRAAVRRAVIAADPDAARRRKEEALERSRVERWNEQTGTTALAGRDLPTAQALAADRYLTGLARELQAAGHPGTLDSLRAQAFLALLAGHDPLAARPGTGTGTGDMSTTGTDAPGTGTPGTGTPGTGTPGTDAPGTGTARAGASGQGTRPGGGVPGIINLTVPLLTWLGLSRSPGDVPGYGPLDADDARDLAAILAGDAATRWCLTLTGADGHPLAHGCARHGPPPPPPDDPGPAGSGAGPSAGPPGGTGSGSGRAPGGRPCPTGAGPAGAGVDPPSAGPDPPVTPATLTWLASVRPEPLARGSCDHARQSAGYRPPPNLVHLIRVRQATCSFPGCRRPATRCDLDHTLPWDQGGITCECNLAPLCRRHHRAKQTQGWRLEQPEPGVLVWTMPSGRTYATRPTSYPAEADLGR